MKTTKHVERSAVNYISIIMHDIIKEKSLKFNEDVGVDTRIVSIKRKAKQKFPDLILEDKKGIKQVYLIEFKIPSWHPYDPELVEDAYLKASRLGIKFFGTCNFNKLIIWRTDLTDVPLMERYIHEYDLVALRKLDDLKSGLVQKKLKNKLTTILTELEQLYFGKITIKKKAIDEFFIELLRTAIDSFYFSISEEIQKKFKENKEFKKHLLEWFTEHGWTFEPTLDNFEKVAKQFLLLFINKILFYNALKLHHKKLKPLILKTTEENATKFKKELDSYFKNVLSIDYESIYSSNFIEEVPLPNELVPHIASFINSLSDKYDFSKVSYDIMGRIFENLIPPDERHRYGQFFTDSNVVDLINTFCIKDADDDILDPGCGAGTFLVRAYTLKKLLDQKQKHSEIIKELYGADISKFASHLANINLSIRDLSAKESYPRIINDDFFNVLPNHKFKEYFKKALSGALINVKIPYMDAVVGNPPYTRQEEIKQTFGERYKDKINKLIEQEFGIKVEGTASIYVHFFIHGTKFLKENGNFGFITSNAWLDVDYGKTIQKFFLDNYKIKAIIESKLERWFEYADTNTIITILEKCNKEDKRNNNIVKFVQLKDKLSNFVPDIDVSDDISVTLKREKRRFNEIKKLIKRIENTNQLYEDQRIKIILKKQKDLFNENKWGKFLRGPPVYFKIFDKNKDLFTQLSPNVAKVIFGMKTGKNSYFYLNNEMIKKWGIEKKFLKPVLKSPKEVGGFYVDSKGLKFNALAIDESKKDLKNTKALKYILFGERQKYPNIPSVRSRILWYSLPKLPKPDILFRQFFDVKFNFPINTRDIIVDHTFYYLVTKPNKSKLIASLLNSTLNYLVVELHGRTNMGEGVLTTYGPEIKTLPIINPAKLSKTQIKKLENAFDKLCKRDAKPIFEEIKMKDRKELDKIIFDFLKLSKNERKQVYDAIVDVVKSRIERATSVQKKSKTQSMSEKAIVENVLSEVDISELKEFPDEFLEENNLKKIIKIPKAENVEIGSDLVHGYYVRVDNKILKCRSEDEAKYLKFAVERNKQDKKIVHMPIRGIEIKIVVKKYSKVLNKIKKNIVKTLDYYTHDKALFNKLYPKILKKILLK